VILNLAAHEWRGPLCPPNQPLEWLLSGYDELLLMTHFGPSTIFAERVS